MAPLFTSFSLSGAIFAMPRILPNVPLFTAVTQLRIAADDIQLVKCSMARTVRKPKIRKQANNEEPIPKYGCGTLHVTSHFQYGGNVTAEGVLDNYGNAEVVVDYLGPSNISFSGMQALCQELGFFNVKDMYIKQSAGYILLQTDHQITSHFMECQLSRTMMIFVDCEGRINTEQQRMFEGEDSVVDEGANNMEAEEVEGEMVGDIDVDNDLEYFSDPEYGMEEDREMGEDLNESVVESLLFEAQIRKRGKVRKKAPSKRKGDTGVGNEGCS